MPAITYPTGVTCYDPKGCWNGYTIFQAMDVGATLIDMNGNVAKQWKDFEGFPNTILPGGYVMGSTGSRDPKHGHQDQVDLVQIDWEGNVVWSFDRYEYVKDPHKRPRWMARQHHDFQREGNPVGYYVPGMVPQVDRGNTLILCHKNLKNPRMSEKPLIDDTFIEVTWDGNIIWEWICSDHFEEMGFSQRAKKALASAKGVAGFMHGMADWMHINCAAILGPNRWFDGGDERFHPDNIIWSGRNTNIMGITDRRTGEIVWQLGPDFAATPAIRKLGQIIGQHHVHMIPKGLPGEGNILIFDNGGHAGYGPPNPGSPTGVFNALRDYSRVIEVNPATIEVIWQYPPVVSGTDRFTIPLAFYSSLVSSAQRLPNGNTLITEGLWGRILEITQQHEIVWEYISPYRGKKIRANLVYRAYRVPYEWVPQAERQDGKAIPRPDNSKFRVPKAPPARMFEVVKIRKGRPSAPQSQLCVMPSEEQ